MAKRRQTIEVEGARHGSPIPMAVKIGNMVFTSGVMGSDPKTGKFPPDPETQAKNIFIHIRSIMEQAGGSPDDIAHVTVLVKDESYRQYINKEWLAMFPDEHDRPTRHAVTEDLRGEMLIQLEVVAVLPS